MPRHNTQSLGIIPCHPHNAFRWAIENARDGGNPIHFAPEDDRVVV